MHPTHYYALIFLPYTPTVTSIIDQATCDTTSKTCITLPSGCRLTQDSKCTLVSYEQAVSGNGLDFTITHRDAADGWAGFSISLATDMNDGDCYVCESPGPRLSNRWISFRGLPPEVDKPEIQGLGNERLGDVIECRFFRPHSMVAGQVDFSVYDTSSEDFFLQNDSKK